MEQTSQTLIVIDHSTEKLLMKSLVFAILFVVISVSCGKKQVSPAKIRVGASSLSFLTGTEVLVVGRNEDEKLYFSKHADENSELDIELENGTWQFAAFYLSSSNNECSDIISKDLDGTDVSIDLSPSVSNCTDSELTDASIWNNTQLKTFRFANCQYPFTSTLGANSNCTDDGGNSFADNKSFRLFYFQADDVVEFDTSSLESKVSGNESR